MPHQLKHFLSDDDIAIILADPVVSEKRNQLNNNSVYFHLNLPNTIRNKIGSLGVSLSDQVPMRWIQGDTPEHADSGIQGFNKTHLIYLTDSVGNFCIGDEEFPIERGCGYVFKEGLRHSTRGAETRLLIGPMSEMGFQVGGGGPAPTICFKQDTKILCQIDGAEQYIPVQTLKKGTLVKTLKNKYVPVDIIGSSVVHNSGDDQRILNRLYRLPKENYPSLKEDLIMTGGHCSLINVIPSYELRQKLIEKQGNVYTTEGKYRLPALLDEKAVPYEQKGTFTIWNFALENKEPNSNYGIYANGLLVESGFHKSIGKHLTIA